TVAVNNSIRSYNIYALFHQAKTQAGFRVHQSHQIRLINGRVLADLSACALASSRHNDTKRSWLHQILSRRRPHGVKLERSTSITVLSVQKWFLAKLARPERTCPFIAGDVGHEFLHKHGHLYMSSSFLHRYSIKDC
uniref:Uncharacterized protein n=1 Tax=Triticum urartu TaxID=4572 RepID=A0A8R7NYN5_TRIUA